MEYELELVQDEYERIHGLGEMEILELARELEKEYPGYYDAQVLLLKRFREHETAMNPWPTTQEGLDVLKKSQQAIEEACVDLWQVVEKYMPQPDWLVPVEPTVLTSEEQAEVDEMNRAIGAIYDSKNQHLLDY